MANGFAETCWNESRETSDSASEGEEEIQVYKEFIVEALYYLSVAVVLLMQVHMPKSKSMPMQRKGSML